MKGLECCDICHTTPPMSEPVSRSRICKANSVWSKVRLTAATTLSARMPKPVNRKRGGAKQF